MEKLREVSGAASGTYCSSLSNLLQRNHASLLAFVKRFCNDVPLHLTGNVPPITNRPSDAEDYSFRVHTTIHPWPLLKSNGNSSRRIYVRETQLNDPRLFKSKFMRSKVTTTHHICRSPLRRVVRRGGSFLASKDGFSVGAFSFSTLRAPPPCRSVRFPGHAQCGAGNVAPSSRDVQNFYKNSRIPYINWYARLEAHQPVRAKWKVTVLNSGEYSSVSTLRCAFLTRRPLGQYEHHVVHGLRSLGRGGDVHSAEQINHAGPPGWDLRNHDGFRCNCRKSGNSRSPREFFCRRAFPVFFR